MEVADSSNGLILGDDFLSGLMRQSMSLDLSDMMEDLFPAEDSQVNINSGSQVTPIDKKAAQDFARQARKLARQDLLELAGQENIGLWRNAIALWMQQHQGEKVSLLQLQHALNMPLVEVWLALLLGDGEQYQWETGKDFYHEVKDVWLREYKIGV